MVTPSALGDSELPWKLEDATPHGQFNPALILTVALNDVKKKLGHEVTRQATKDLIIIPKHLSKVWVQAFFDYKRKDGFVGLINRKVIELMPELISMDHVHVDAAIILIYYAVLFHGCGIATCMATPSAIHYSKPLYIYCLRALPGWQREATGTITDLIAAVSMFTVCTGSFDFQLGMQMLKKACEYVQGHDIQITDIGGSDQQGKSRDEYREGFWELVRIDVISQLLFDKPPYITASTWKVNVPLLEPGSKTDENEITTTLSVAAARIALILARFFPLLESADDTQEQLMPKTEALCHEVQKLYIGGGLDQKKLTSTDIGVDVWKATDVALTGHACILFMLRKAVMKNARSPAIQLLEHELASSPMVIEASRSIIEISLWLLNRWPWLASVSFLFGRFLIHLPYALLVHAACHTSNTAAYAIDIERIYNLHEIIVKIIGSEKEYLPLLRGLRAVNNELRRRFG